MELIATLAGGPPLSWALGATDRHGAPRAAHLAHRDAPTVTQCPGVPPMTTLTIGVDPGKSGAVAALDEAGRLVHVVDMPTAGEVSAALLDDLFYEWGVHYFSTSATVVVEEVAAFPKNGSIGNFKLGMAYGIVLGVVGSRWPLVRVRPATWKRAMGLSADKDLSRRKAIDLWPEHASSFARKKDDGRAEACLLAKYHQLQVSKGVAAA